MNEIKINHYGKILKGDKKDWFVFIKDDREISGGFLILISPSINSKSGFDDWVLDYKTLEEYFIESQWEIEWE